MTVGKKVNIEGKTCGSGILMKPADQELHHFQKRVKVLKKGMHSVLISYLVGGSKIARNSVFNCHLSPVAMKNSVSNDFLSTFVDSWRFRLPPSRCVFGLPCDSPP